MTQPFQDRVILCDRWGLQAAAKLETPGRLSGEGSLVDWLQRLGATVRFGDLNAFEDVDVAVLTTRTNRPYDLAELDALTAFVHGGGGLLCCSNHGSSARLDPRFNATRFDLAVASTFFALFEPLRYRHKPAKPFVGRVVGPLRGQPGWPGPSNGVASTIQCNNSCAVLPGPCFQPSVALEGEGLSSSLFGTTPSGEALWSGTLSGGPAGEGRVVLCADSGWLANTTSMAPGPGQFQLADNTQYLINAVRWLLMNDD